MVDGASSTMRGIGDRSGTGRLDTNKIIYFELYPHHDNQDLGDEVDDDDSWIYSFAHFCIHSFILSFCMRMSQCYATHAMLSQSL